MRIAQIAPLAEAVPPRLYGGTERVVSWLTEELVALGHDVTLFASGDSVTSARLEPVWPMALHAEPGMLDPIAPQLLQLERVRARAAAFDILHFHLHFWPASLFARQPTPFVSTLHGRLDLPELRPAYLGLPRMPVVSISDAQRAPLPELNYVATVHHGLPEASLRPPPGRPTYLAFLGRISIDKGPDAAIAIARQAGLRLLLAAKIEPIDQPYFEARVRPLLDPPNVELIGEIGDADKAAFLGGAVALLMPIDWPEPFGLVMIEAMACGTPVIAFRRGAAPEVVEDGVTGFVVDDVAGAVAALRRIGTLSRTRVRAAFERRFTARRMALDYVGVYRRLIECGPAAWRPSVAGADHDAALAGFGEGDDPVV